MTKYEIKIREALGILAVIAEDLAVSVYIFKRLKYDLDMMKGMSLEIPIYRVTMTNLVISCSKYSEFCRKYGELVNCHASNLVSEMNSYRSTIEERRINNIRNDFIGHIHSKKLGRPLNNEEVRGFFFGITGGEDISPFLDWVFSGDEKSVDDNCLIGFIYRLIDVLREKL